MNVIIAGECSGTIRDAFARLGHNAWFWSLLFAYFVIVLIGHFATPYDSTDAPNERSGLKAYTDHLTGCEYLSNENGSLTPRLDSFGKQICGSGR